MAEIGPYGFDGGGEPTEVDFGKRAAENKVITQLECDIEGHDLREVVDEDRKSFTMCIRCLGPNRDGRFETTEVPRG